MTPASSACHAKACIKTDHARLRRRHSLRRREATRGARRHPALRSGYINDYPTAACGRAKLAKSAPHHKSAALIGRELFRDGVTARPNRVYGTRARRRHSPPGARPDFLTVNPGSAAALAVRPADRWLTHGAQPMGSSS